MKTPPFWYEPPGLAANLLAPLGGIYGLATSARRTLASPRRVNAKIICVGNLVAGGSGKTPVALALAKLLPGRSIAFLTRGYGGALSGPVRVDPATHTAHDVGDEALLLARAAPCWLAHDRVAGAEAAIAGGADTIIMDDGFQNPSLQKDLSLLVVNGEDGFGNRYMIPAGPLREGIAQGMARAQGVIVIGRNTYRVERDLPSDMPVFPAHLMAPADSAELTGKSVLAFAGIGRPERFFETLRVIGCRVVAQHPFADHHPYTPVEIESLCQAAAATDAIAVTTEKDWVRLPANLRDKVRVLPVSLEWKDSSGVSALLHRHIG